MMAPAILLSWHWLLSQLTFMAETHHSASTKGPNWRNVAGYSGFLLLCLRAAALHPAVGEGLQHLIKHFGFWLPRSTGTSVWNEPWNELQDTDEATVFLNYWIKRLLMFCMVFKYILFAFCFRAEITEVKMVVILTHTLFCKICKIKLVSISLNEGMWTASQQCPCCLFHLVMNVYVNLFTCLQSLYNIGSPQDRPRVWELQSLCCEVSEFLMAIAVFPAFSCLCCGYSVPHLVSRLLSALLLPLLATTGSSTLGLLPWISSDLHLPLERKCGVSKKWLKSDTVLNSQTFPLNTIQCQKPKSCFLYRPNKTLTLYFLTLPFQVWMRPYGDCKTTTVVIWRSDGICGRGAVSSENTDVSFYGQQKHDSYLNVIYVKHLSDY